MADIPKSIQVYICPVCGTWDESEHYTGGHDFDRFPDCHRNQREPRRYVLAEPTDPQVRQIALKAFPATRGGLSACRAVRRVLAALSTSSEETPDA